MTIAGAAIMLTSCLTLQAAAQRSSATIYYPPTSIERPQDLGKFAHTNYVLHTSNGMKPAGTPQPPPGVETPSSLQCLLGLISSPAGDPYLSCNISRLGTRHAVGGWGAIALVDAFDDPTAASDLQFFASQYALPVPTFTQVKVDTSHGYSGASCANVPPDQGWALEESLDIEWSFSMAETAHIYLVEACSSSFTDLLYAELAAGQLVRAAGGGDISNSWGGGEFAGETAYDPYFFDTCLPGDTHCTNGYWDRIVYFASAGDSGCGAQWPSSSPWVVSAGGTTINRNSMTGNFTTESCWSGSGGGVSSQETWGGSFPTGMGPWVNFQYAQFGQTARQTPDISADADPNSGVGVYCNSCGGGPWFQVGGTSLASPLLAGAVNIAGNKLGQAPHGGSGNYTNEQNAFMYSELYTVSTKSSHFYDVSTGTNGCPVTAGWDQCTGIGSPLGYSGH
jgi:subtilase family serine protease